MADDPNTTPATVPQPAYADTNLPDRNPTFAEYDQLPQPMRAEYQKSKLAYSQAYAAFDAALADAVKTYQKPFYDWQKAYDDYVAANDAQAAAVDRARAALADINAMTAAPKTAAAATAAPDGISNGPLDASYLTDPDKAKVQTARLQTAVDAFKKAADDVATAGATVSTARDALAKVADGVDKLDTPNTRTKALAEDQYALDYTTAQTPLEAAYDALLVKQTELIGRIGKVNPPTKQPEPAQANASPKQG